MSNKNEPEVHVITLPFEHGSESMSNQQLTPALDQSNFDQQCSHAGTNLRTSDERLRLRALRGASLLDGPPPRHCGVLAAEENPGA